MTDTRLRPFIAASGLSNLADGVAIVAWAWLASLLTRDPLLTATMPVALRLPWVLFAIPAGLVTDRADRRHLILCVDCVRMADFAVAAVFLWLALLLRPAPDEGLSSPVLFAGLMCAALSVAIAEVFRDNAAQTMLPAIVPPEKLERANGRLWSVELVGSALIGPALGAWLVAAFLPGPFLLNAVCFALSVLLMLRPTGGFRPDPRPRNWRAELLEGWAFLCAAPTLRLLAVVTGIWNLLHQMVVIALILHVQENLGLGARAYGLFLAAGAVGGIVGGLLAEWVIAAIGPGRAAQWMTAASGVAFAAIPLAPDGWTLALVFAGFELTGLIWNTVSVSYRQRAIPDALLGRVNSLYRLLAWGMMPVGLVLSGVAVRVADGPVSREAALVTPFWIAAAGALLLTAAAWRGLGRGFGVAVTRRR
ncbi:MFS transporter [Jannaschia aquimarina]|uniref:Enterobactin exporter EntS n=1 Tax=Jannaschia aquimarina TaxID=935700 RepID=A0A0D1CMC0_9RHOB|nr:MFS transporter [Jannaschia aquimarina]KIT15912.1 enterobactin exporter EntS [Jannaschia aquimarina]SNS97645.1 Transmembrane secretion effector [Jannaschia aquimarina]